MQKFPNGKRMPGALRLYQIDTDVFKDLLFWRFSEESTEPITFHAETELRYLRQLTAEKKVLTKQRKEVWKQIRPDNHWLDCAVGHLAMTHWQWEPNLQRAAQMKKTSKSEARAKSKLRDDNVNRPSAKTGGKPSWFENR
jgi:phage terminase large subunit GpA-like protein